jgi:hypothetical protein
MMAVTKFGALGSFSGKVGNVVGTYWKGINYLRSMPQYMHNPRSKGQVNQREKIKAVAVILSGMVPYLRLGFASEAINMSAYNAATREMLRNGVKGEYPHLEIDYEHLKFSAGPLVGASGATVSSEAGKVIFGWKDNSGVGNARHSDCAMPMLYNVTKKLSESSLNVANRRAGTGVLNVPSSWKGDTVYAYLAFWSADEMTASGTTGLGMVEMVGAGDAGE